MTDADKPHPSPAPDSKKPPRRGRWRRRALYTLLTLAVLAIVLRIALIFALPAVLRNVAESYGLKLSYDRYALSLLGGNAELWRLLLTASDAPDQRVAYAEYIQGDVSTWDLLRGRLVVYRAEADGVDVLIERAADGSIPLLERFLADRSEPAPVAAAATSTTQHGEVDLTSPVRIDAFRFQHLNATFRDHTVTPAVDTTLRMSVRLSDLASGDRPTRFELSVHSDPLLDIMLISGQGTAAGRNLDATMDVLVRGMRLREAASVLEPLGIRPVADDLSMRARAVLKTEPAADNAPGLAAHLLVEDVRALADSQEAFALDRLAIEAPNVGYDAIRVAPVRMQGLRLRAGRSEAGFLRFAGVELIPTAGPNAASAPAVPPTTAPATQPASDFQWRLDGIELTDLRAAFDDAAVAPAAALELALDAITIGAIDSAAPEAPVPIRVRARAEGIAGSIELTGTAAPLAARRTASFDLAIAGIRPDALRPYLAAAGIESNLADATFTARADATWSIGGGGVPVVDVRLSDIALADGGPRVALDEARLSGLRLAEDEIAIAEVALRGPALEIRRDAAGVIETAGLRLVGGSSKAPQRASTSAPVARPPATQPAAPMPRIRLDRLTWSDVRLTLRDEFVQPATQLALSNFGLEMNDIVVGLSGGAAEAPPGRVRLWLAAESMADRIELTGTVRAGADALALAFDLTGNGITAAGLSPYLAPLGIEPALRDGRLRLHADATVAQDGDALAIGVTVRDLAYSDADTELIGLTGLSVKDARLSTGETRIEEIALDRPRLRVRKGRNGALEVAGVRTRPVEAAQPAQAAAPVPAAESQPVSLPATLILQRLRLQDGQVHWIDDQIDAELHAIAQVAVDKLIVGGPSDKNRPPATVRMALTVPGTLERLTIDGQATADAAAPLLALDLSAAGLREGGLAAYLPPGVGVALRDGRFKARIEAGAAEHPEGGRSLRASVTGVNLRDGEAPPVLALDSAGIVVSRFDPPGQVIAIDEVFVRGLEADATILADGGMSAAGLVLRPAPPAATPAAAVVEEPPRSAPAPTAIQADARELARRGRETLPLVTIETVDLGLRRLSIRGERRADAQPVVLADFVLRNPRRIELLGPDAADRPPIELTLDGRIDPLVESVRVALEASPFAQQPLMKLDLALAGIRGEGLLAAAPELRETIDPAALKSGVFTTRLEADARWNRRGPADFSFADGVDVNLAVTDVAFRAEPDGPVLAGVGEVRAEQMRIEPKSGRVRIKSLEVSKPIARARREADGLHVLGLVIKPPPAGGSTSQTDAAPVVQEQPAAVPTAASQATGQGEFRIDRLLVQGADVRLEDRVVDPPFVLPVGNLDLEVRDLSDRALVEPRPIRFSLLLNSDKTDLPGRRTTVTELREVFAQISADGRVALYPKPDGWAKVAVSGFDLNALRGYASQAGITLSDGAFDGSVDVRFGGDGTMDTRSRLVFTDLSVAEPANGPISKLLVLPAPLDVVLGALSDPDGSITLPLHIPIRDGQVSGIGPAVAGAVGSVVTTAMASASVKAVGGVGALVGLQDVKRPIDPVVISFAPGDTSLSADARAAIESLVRQLERDSALQVTLRHEMGGGDVGRLAARANPSAEQALQMASLLEGRRAALAEARSAAAQRARAALASGAGGDGEAGIETVRDLDRQIAQTESALDQLYDLLRPGAQRQAGRRTRAACLDLGQARLDTVSLLLTQAGLPDAPSRIRAIRPQFSEPEGDAGGTVTVTVVEVSRK